MRGGTRQRPASQHGAMHASAQPVRKVFNCIIDDSALVAGVKRSTRNGIRQWVKNGQIRLFVPLHALDQLSQQREAPAKHGEDVRETLQWLDDVTSRYPNVVTLQGADETYEQWAEVEKFVVPRTLFSENDGMEDGTTEGGSAASPEQHMAKLSLDNLPPKDAASSAATDGTRSLSPASMDSQRSSMSARSPPTSPLKEAVSPARRAHERQVQPNTGSGSVPAHLQPLFNYILWRIHQEVDPVAALESFIFLCNDQRKVNFAKGFEIKTKRLEQLREAINREDRDFKNRVALLGKEANTSNANATSKKSDEEDDDEVVYKPPPRAPAAMLPKQQQANVMDPDAFGRNPATQTQQRMSPKQQSASVQAGRGAFANQFPSRGNQRGNFRGNQRGRGNFNPSTPRSLAGADGGAPNGAIDPNSFARPRGNGFTGRGARKLWVPT